MRVDVFLGLLWTTTAFQSPWQPCKQYNRGELNRHSAASFFVDIDEGTPRDIGTFDEWASASGVQRCEGFQLVATTEEPALDVGVMTTEDLPTESPVIFVPSEMTLSANRAEEEFGRVANAEDLFARLGVNTEERQKFYLFLKILKEYEMGDESLWYPWLNALPRYFSTGASMTHFCCTDCLPPLVGNLAMRERTNFRRYFKALDYCATFLSQSTTENKKLAKWAYNVVYTRSFPDGHDDIKIAPMGDMFNHDTQWEIQGRYDEDGNFYAYATYDIPAGSPLRMSYTAGDSSNPSYLFARYGFLDESSPGTFCKIMISDPTPELVNMGYDHSRMLFYKDTGEVASEVWDVLLYQVLGGVNPDHQKALYEAHMKGDIETKAALHEQYMAQTSEALRSHVDTFLNQLDELSSQSIGRDLNVHPRLPLIQRHNEFVKETFLNVRNNLLQLQY